MSRANDTVVRVVLLEDEDLLRGLLGEWLSSLESVRVVDQFRSIAAFNGALETTLAETDLLVVDVNLPDGDGIEAAARLRASRGTAVPVVVISGQVQPDLFDRLSSTFESAWAFLYKDSNGLANLRHSMDAVLDGLVMVDPNVRGHANPVGRGITLTQQEEAVMKLVADGKSNSTIASELFVSEKTVERLLTSIYGKYDIIGNSKAMNPRVRATLLYRNLISS